MPLREQPLLIVAISDTHVPSRARSVPEALVARIRKADLLLHAGSFTTLAVYNQIADLATLVAVLGDVDERLTAEIIYL